MKNVVKVTIDIDLNSGDYNLTFYNKSNPGLPMDLNQIKPALGKVVSDFVSGKSKENTKAYN